MNVCHLSMISSISKLQYEAEISGKNWSLISPYLTCMCISLARTLSNLIIYQQKSYCGISVWTEVSSLSTCPFIYKSLITMEKGTILSNLYIQEDRSSSVKSHSIVELEVSIHFRTAIE